MWHWIQRWFRANTEAQRYRDQARSAEQYIAGIADSVEYIKRYIEMGNRFKALEELNSISTLFRVYFEFQDERFPR
jgi:hypothetical protein